MKHYCVFCGSQFFYYNFYLKCFTCSNENVLVCKNQVYYNDTEVIFQKYCRDNQYRNVECFIRFSDFEHINFISYKFNTIIFSMPNATITKLFNKIEIILTFK